VFVSFNEVPGCPRLLCNFQIIAHVPRTLLNFYTNLKFYPRVKFIRHGGKCADDKAHEWSLFKRSGTRQL
jgi:hypothetical protein